MSHRTIAEKLRDKKYYSLAHKGSIDLNYPATKLLINEAILVNNILDLGCGEGTRLDLIIKYSKNKHIQAFGTDNNRLAIDLAKKKYQKYNFLKADLESLPFKDDQFDLEYSAFVFEHLKNPEKVLKEAKRVLKKNGKLLILAPNFGSPNRRSPNSSENKLKKLLIGFLKDILIMITFNIQSLEWTKVTPKFDHYITDADTTIEPYLNSLIKYCKSLEFNIEYFSSNWQIDNFSFFQLPFKMLGQIGLYPFNLWGPHLCLLIKKIE